MPRRRGGRRKGRKPRRRKVRRLPNDVLTDIFHKLPCNSMVRSKLVCKEWYSIISNPDFMQEYFKRIGKHFILYELFPYGKFNIYDVNCSNLINNNDTAILSSIPPLEDPRKWGCNDENLEIIGSCDGLVALANSINLILWNPITKHYKSFSGEYWFFEPRWGWSFSPRVLWGLCYDADRQEYSVVVAIDYQSPPVSPTNFDASIGYETEPVYVVDCKTGKQRKLNNYALPGRLLDGKLFNGEAGKVVCGVPHWVVRFYDFQNPWVQREILYFDSKEEKFKQMAGPNQGGGGGGDEKTMLGLATLEGERQLGIVFHHVNTSTLEVWVMKEYGEPESWTNLFKIPYLSNIAADSMDVLGFMPNGELLIRSNDLWAHDLENGTSKHIEIKDGAKESYFVAVEYEPSLISNPESRRNTTPENQKELKCTRKHE